jgi:transcriptional regulator with XRE-family HTH domain
MAPVESLDPDSSMWDAIASDLRFYREKTGLSLTQLANKIGCTRQTVSNMEYARPTHRLNADQAAALDELWELNRHFRRLLRWARTRHHPQWFQEYEGYETKASSLRMFEPLLVPGLFQTEDYARTMLTAARVVKDVEAAVRRRMERQQLLTREDPPLLWVLLDEGVLDRPVGGSAVMRAQLERMLEVGSLPNVTIRVIPRAAGFHVGLEGSFVLATIPDGELAYMEAWGGGRLEEDRAAIRRYGTLYDRIGAEALPESSSRTLMRQILEKM